jgi:hypothetical protein
MSGECQATACSWPLAGAAPTPKAAANATHVERTGSAKLYRPGATANVTARLALGLSRRPRPREAQPEGLLCPAIARPKQTFRPSHNDATTDKTRWPR